MVLLGRLSTPNSLGVLPDLLVGPWARDSRLDTPLYPIPKTSGDTLNI